MRGDDGAMMDMARWLGQQTINAQRAAREAPRDLKEIHETRAKQRGGTMRQLKDNDWGDKRYSFTVEVTMTKRSASPEKAKQVLRDMLGPNGDIYNWEGKFALITDIR